LAKFSDFQWEDETDTETENPKNQENSDFASLLDGEKFETLNLRVGQAVSATISSISTSSENVLVEISAQQTGVMDKQDLLDENGDYLAQEGQSVDLYVVSLRDSTIQLSTSMGSAHQSLLDLEVAQENAVPVKGKVVKANKGGFEVAIMNRQAFCPISKIDRNFVENPQDYVGKDLEFLIEKVEANGRNIVVNRSKILEQAAIKRLEDLKKSLADEQILEGRVREIRDYGAFVDLGGIDGFLHISELSFARQDRVSDFITVNEMVRVKIIEIKQEGDRSRISISMKAVEQDPWLAIDDLDESVIHQGKVLKISKHGAFVQLKPGLDGFVHLSEMSWEKRVHSANDVLSIGDIVDVKILNIDKPLKRISLSLKGTVDDPFDIFSGRTSIGHTMVGKITNLKGFGAIVELEPGITGLVPISTLKVAHGESYRKKCSPPQELQVTIKEINREERKILLALPGTENTDEDQDFRQYLGETRPKASAQTGSFGELLKAKLEGK